MVQLGLTPWRELSELLAAREQFYPSGPAHNARRQETPELRHAVNLVNAWKLRGHIPHAVESTALLIDAILHQDVERNSVFDVRAVYGAAFSRFVTGYCDTQQGRAFKMSMFDMAEELNMPAHFVDMRHEITHSHLPTLQRLQIVTEEALGWLWHVYWSTLDSQQPTATDEDGPRKAVDVQVDADVLKEGIRAILKTWLRERRTEVKKGSKAESTSDANKLALERLLEFCEDRVRMLEALVAVLVEDKLVVPSDKTRDSTMKGAFLIWDGLILLLAMSLNDFLKTFVLRMITTMARPSSDLTKEEWAFDSALHQWVLHILLDAPFSQLGERNIGNLRTSAVEASILSPQGSWALTVTADLLDNVDEDFREQWLPVYDACDSSSYESDDEEMQDLDDDPDVPLSPDDKDGNSKDENAGSKSSKERNTHSAGSTRHTRPGWRQWSGVWHPTPIGVLPGNSPEDQTLDQKDSRDGMPSTADEHSLLAIEG